MGNSSVDAMAEPDLIERSSEEEAAIRPLSLGRGRIQKFPGTGRMVGRTTYITIMRLWLSGLNTSRSLRMKTRPL